VGDFSYNRTNIKEINLFSIAFKLERAPTTTQLAIKKHFFYFEVEAAVYTEKSEPTKYLPNFMVSHTRQT
jgi:hypothetical protein